MAKFFAGSLKGMDWKCRSGKCGTKKTSKGGKCGTETRYRSVAYFGFQ